MKPKPKEVRDMGKSKKKAENKTIKAKNRKGGAQKPEKPKVEAKPAQKPGNDELDGLRKPVEVAKASLEKAQEEAKALTERARTLVTDAKHAYHTVLAPYRDACKKAGVKCEFSGGRLANVSERVTFIVEKVDKGVKVAIKGREKETEEVIPTAKLKESVNKAAFWFTDKHLGPREEIGNKGGGLSNRLRKVMA
jgi:hypothetical protein